MFGGQNVGVTDTPWAVPEEEPAVGDAAPAVVAHTAQSAPASAPSAAVGRLVPHLAVFERPVTVADVLDGAFQVIKFRPRTVVAVAALFVVPVGLLVAIADIGVLGGDVVSTLTDPETYEENSTAGDSDLGLTVFSTLVSSFLVTLIAAPLARLVEAWYVGRDPSPADLISGLGWSWGAIIVGFVVVHVIEGVATVFFLLPGLVAMTCLLVVAPAIAVERLGPFRAVRRSFDLVRRRFWSTLWVALLAGLVANTLSVLLPLLPLAIAALFGFGGEQYVAAAGTVASSLLTLPFVAGAAVITYFDLRVRTEGLDIDLAIGEQFDTAR